ncbi:MAG TPA: hypothetical protein EYP23_03475 [Thermoplasmata archaeon]|nr:hypothetical protein [Thermoplasmata archaeon]
MVDMTSKPGDLQKLHRVLDDEYCEEVTIEDKYVESVCERLYGKRKDVSSPSLTPASAAENEASDVKLKPSVEIYGGGEKETETKEIPKKETEEEVSESIREEDEELFEVEKLSPEEITALKVEKERMKEEKKEPKVVPRAKPETEKQQFIETLAEIKGLGKKKAALLYDHGFTSPEKLLEADSKDLAKVKRISRRLAEEIQRKVMESQPKMAAEFDQMYVLDKETAREKTEVEEHLGRETSDVEEELPEWVTLDKAPVDEELPEWKAVDEEPYRYGEYTLYKVEKRTLKGKKKTLYVFSKKPVNGGVPSKLPSGYVVKVKGNKVPVLEQVK